MKERFWQPGDIDDSTLMEHVRDLISEEVRAAFKQVAEEDGFFHLQVGKDGKLYVTFDMVESDIPDTTAIIKVESLVDTLAFTLKDDEPDEEGMEELKRGLAALQALVDLYKRKTGL